MPDDIQDPAATAAALRKKPDEAQQIMDEIKATRFQNQLIRGSMKDPNAPPPPPSDPYSTSMRGRISDAMSRWWGPKTPDPTAPTP
jgi:hypothetical protein